MKSKTFSNFLNNNIQKFKGILRVWETKKKPRNIFLFLHSPLEKKKIYSLLKSSILLPIKPHAFCCAIVRII